MDEPLPDPNQIRRRPETNGTSATQEDNDERAERLGGNGTRHVQEVGLGQVLVRAKEGLGN